MIYTKLSAIFNFGLSEDMLISTSGCGVCEFDAGKAFGFDATAWSTFGVEVGRQDILSNEEGGGVGFGRAGRNCSAGTESDC